MTKKDYELIASAIKDMQQLTTTTGLLSRWDVVQVLADRLLKDNPRFNKDKFLKACGIED